MSRSFANKSVDVYIFHGIEDVVMGFFLGDKLLDYQKIPKVSIGEKWVEAFRYLMEKLGIQLPHIGSIYLNSSFSTWNASRLITLFVKTIATCADVTFYLREESQDKLDIDSSLKSFHRDRKSFRCVESAILVVPIYKKCQGIST